MWFVAFALMLALLAPFILMYVIVRLLWMIPIRPSLRLMLIFGFFLFVINYRYR